MVWQLDSRGPLKSQKLKEWKKGIQESFSGSPIIMCSLHRASPFVNLYSGEYFSVASAEHGSYEYVFVGLQSPSRLDARRATSFCSSGKIAKFLCVKGDWKNDCSSTRLLLYRETPTTAYLLPFQTDRRGLYRSYVQSFLISSSINA